MFSCDISFFINKLALVIQAFVIFLLIVVVVVVVVLLNKFYIYNIGNPQGYYIYRLCYFFYWLIGGLL